MSEVAWYCHIAERGRKPRSARLARMRGQSWEAPVHLAIAMLQGMATSCPPGTNGHTGEMAWFWIGGPRSPSSDPDWVLVPRRVAHRAHLLYEQAVSTAVCAGGGGASSSDAVQVLRRWTRSRHWQRVIARSMHSRSRR